MLITQTKLHVVVERSDAPRPGPPMVAVALFVATLEVMLAVGIYLLVRNIT